MKSLRFCKNHDISHNDLKPANILYKIDEYGKILVKLSDFGQFQKTGGTPGFISPENFSDPIITTSDIWSLGKTLLFLYTCEKTFRCLTQIPLIPEENAKENDMHCMVDSLIRWLTRHPILVLVQNLLTLGLF